MGFNKLISWTVFSAETINATAAVTSSAFSLEYATLESLLLTATSTADAHDLKIDLLVSDTEAGTYSDPLDFVELTASTGTDFANSATDTIPISIPPTLGRWVQVRATGVGANPADTALTLIAMGREEC
jgi:hypothetical protein